MYFETMDSSIYYIHTSLTFKLLNNMRKKTVKSRLEEMRDERGRRNWAPKKKK
jgi:hypothetical protein